MVVDDDRSTLKAFTRLLERKSYSVTAVETGREALARIEQNRFDAALIDVHLPDIDGFEILPKIQEKSPETVKIIFTGSPDYESHCDTNPPQMDALLIKPVNPETLFSILDKRLNCRKQGA